MVTFCVNLNIHYSAPQRIWDEIIKIYAEMPYWKGFVDGCPQWQIKEGKYIEGSVEPSGLQLYAKQLTEKEWNEWLQLFKDKATAVVGYPVDEPEDGYHFKYW